MRMIDFGDSRVWRKASRSADNGGACLCVTRRDGDGMIGVRDSKAGPGGPVQWYPAGEWLAFLAEARRGAFDAGGQAPRSA